jgi:hypothetical protein
MERDTSRPDLRRAASRVVVALGLYQGAVPLVVRGAFGGDQRFAPALWLPSPWWWIACAGIVALAVAAAAALEPDDEQPNGSDGATTTDRPDGSERQGPATPAAAYDALSAVVFLLGVYNGIAPFVARLVFDGDLLLAVTLRLPAPWWWITSLAVVAAAIALLEAIDRAKQRRLVDDG